MVDGLLVAAIHEIAVAQTDVGVALQVGLTVVAALHETLEASDGIVVIGFLVIDVTQSVIGHGGELTVGGVLSLLVIAFRRGEIAGSVGRFSQPEGGFSLPAS